MTQLVNFALFVTSFRSQYTKSFLDWMAVAVSSLMRNNNTGVWRSLQQQRRPEESMSYIAPQHFHKFFPFQKKLFTLRPQNKVHNDNDE